ncbi:MAG: type III pantothenate kinase [Crocinitomicaceae bacterium]|mgnify:CR=1 FL=1|jgi:type III pantothenate kinase|nr:type III pantothenate kinase [Crocinitomicaceae bacterium]MBT6029652.1 type III pantothenate kinase [Crocinitomicaceae bacterium]MBT6515508.1 type III pantothenate kinase [Crocinitomicaceae bacterium]
MNLIIDVGNTSTKVAAFDGKTLIKSEKYDRFDQSNIQNDFDITLFESAILSNVTDRNETLETFINTFKKGHVLSDSSIIPFKNTYLTPDSLGQDRLANAAGLAVQFPSNNSLCIDLGTCMKFDFVDAEGNYRGGAISPGFNMRFKALNTFTDKLPFIDLQSTKKLIGNDTEESITSGVFNGMLAEINGIIRCYQEQFDEINIVLTGGDATFFENELKNTIFADAFFTLRGLNAILSVNV